MKSKCKEQKCRIPTSTRCNSNIPTFSAHKIFLKCHFNLHEPPKTKMNQPEADKSKCFHGQGLKLVGTKPKGCRQTLLQLLHR